MFTMRRKCDIILIVDMKNQNRQHGCCFVHRETGAVSLREKVIQV